jgi:hypothetical protein
MFSDEVLKFLFMDYISSESVYRHMESDPTMQKYEDKYVQTIEIFTESFGRGIYSPNFKDEIS